MISAMTANSTLRFGSDVDQSVRDALAANPSFVHPDFIDRPAWVIRNGMPRQARIVGAVRGSSADYTITALDVLADGENVVIRTHRASVFWSQDEASLAQGELDETLDL